MFEDMKVLYLCDRRACRQCRPPCTHTSDIAHAKNFELGLDDQTMIETSRPIVVFKIEGMLSHEMRNKIRDGLMTQLGSNMVLCDSLISPIVVKDGAKIYDCVITERKEEDTNDE